MYRNLGSRQKALEDYDKAIELAPDYANAYLERGILYHNLGEFPKALRDYDKKIELNPKCEKCEIAYFNRGLLYGEFKEFEKAIKDFTRAIQLDTKYKNAYLNRAYAYEALGQKALAEADRKAAAEL